MSLLEQKLSAVLPGYINSVSDLKAGFGSQSIGSVTAGQAAGGMRGVNALVCDTSEVDPHKGLIIRGYPIRDLEGRLPEEVFWLLLTGAFPDEDELIDLQLQISARMEVPAHVWRMLEQMPKDSHPMAMLSAALMTMHYESAFAYRVWNKRFDRFWALMLEDALRLMGRLPVLAAGIYRMRFNKGPRLYPNPRLDLAANFAHLAGLGDDPGFAQFMRRFLVVHSDHESGNATAYTTLTVASALNDAYLSLSAGMNALAGPLHGLASQKCVDWLLDTRNAYGRLPSVGEMENEVRARIEGGRLVHGYGHAVLRAEDPRFTSLYEFGKQYFPESEMFMMADLLYHAAPEVLKQRARAACPYPNVDAVSGACLHHYGITETPFYTVLFGLGLSAGLLAQMVLARALKTPMMRPKSVTTKWVREFAGEEG